MPDATEANSILRIAIISDVHAYSQARTSDSSPAPSFVEISNPSVLAGRNPFVAARELITREGISADILINCGDMSDKAQPDAIDHTWRETNKLAEALGVEQIIATTGNHDLDSRGEYTDHDARGTLLSLKDFPFTEESLNNEYWARNVVVMETDKAQWVVLNSAAYHGFKDEHAHGRVSPSTLEYLKRRLSKTSNEKLNILLCHHHVYKIGDVDLSDYSAL